MSDKELDQIRQRYNLVVKSGMTAELAVEKFGYRWMSWTGIPIKGTPGYPAKMRVRQLMSPTQLESPSWKHAWSEPGIDGQPATGDEPLSYAYCSAGGAVAELPSLKDEREKLLTVDLPRLLAEVERLRNTNPKVKR